MDLEEAVLGALMIDKNAISEVVDILHTDCFYKESHQEIYDSLTELFNDAEPIDILTVTEKLKKR